MKQQEQEYKDLEARASWSSRLKSAYLYISFFLKENREGQERANDFIDIYLNEMDKEETRLHPSFTLQSLEIILLDLFVAGSDTTSLTINWTILYLLHHPQVQVKLHAELDRVVGRSRFSHLSLYKL